MLVFWKASLQTNVSNQIIWKICFFSEHAPSAGDYSRSEYAREDADNYGANEYAYDHAGGNVCHMH